MALDHFFLIVVIVGVFLLMVLLFLLCLSCVVLSKDCNVRDYGAKGDGKTVDTKAINSAISDKTCNRITFDHGTFVSGSVRLLSHKIVEIQKDATLKAAPQDIDAFDHPLPNPWSQYQDFGHNHWRNALIWGVNVTNVQLCGGGLIDGDQLYGGTSPDGAGDKLIGIQSSSHVEIFNLAMKNTGHFALLATNVEHLHLHDLVVRPQRDGFDIVSCRHVEIHNCDIQLGPDDALAFKSDYSLGRTIHSFDVVVRDSIVGSTLCTGLEIGSETVGDFYDYHFENITVTYAGTGIGIASMDGSNIRNFVYRNIRLARVASAIQLYIGARGNHPKEVGTISGFISNILFENITAETCIDPHNRNWTIAFDGQPVNITHGVHEAHPIGPKITFRI